MILDPETGSRRPADPRCDRDYRLINAFTIRNENAHHRWALLFPVGLIFLLALLENTGVVLFAADPDPFVPLILGNTLDCHHLR